MAQSVRLPALHGRVSELELLEASLERAAAGSLQIVLVEGEPGIGKSRILESLVGTANSYGFRAFVGRADEVERRPFGPLAEALGCFTGMEGRRGEIARLLRGDLPALRPPIEPSREPGLQFRVLDAFVDLVEDLALRDPILLALDDLHWADSSTLLAVRSLARRLTYLPLALILTLRPMPRPRGLDELVDALIRSGGARLALGPLADEAVANLVAELVAAEPAPALVEEVAGAAGNPLFVRELVMALEEEGEIDVVDGSAELRDPSLPPSLRLTILRRLSFLSEEALEVLRVASVLGSTFSVRDIATVLARPATSLVAPVREALHAGVLEEQENRLAFRHDLIRTAIYEDLPRDIRAALHLEAGRRLAAAGAPALRVAEQLGLGAQPGDLDAVTRLHDAARHAAARAPAIAAGLLERALELANDSHEVRLRLVADLVPTLLWSGRPQEAEGRARRTLEAQLPPDLEGAVRLGLVAALSAQGRHVDVVEEAERATRKARLTPDIRSQLLAEAANSLGFADDLDGAERVAREAVELGEPVRSEGAAMGLLVLADTARVRGKPGEALRLAQQAVEQAPASAEGRLRWPPELFLAMTFQQLDRFEEADDSLREGRRADEQLGNVSYLPVYQYEAAAIRFSAGRWNDALADAQAGLELAEEVGLGMLRVWPHSLLALIAVHRGALDEACSWLESHPGSQAAALPHALLQEARGDRAGALATLGRAWDDDAARGVIYRRRAQGPDLVRLALAAGDRNRAEAVARGLEEAARPAAVPSLKGAALHCRGLVEADPELLLRSVEAYRKSPRAFERALACESAASEVARRGRTGEATVLFDEALAEYERAGAQWDAARALASMRRLGLGRKRRGARKRPETGWESLTPSELEVVRLAATGLTNNEIGQRLFISGRTVQTHLAHTFRKLDLSSRVELAAEAARRGGV